MKLKPQKQTAQTSAHSTCTSMTCSCVCQFKIFFIVTPLQS